jgi:fructose-bisphosphate aldolase class II
MLASLKHLLNQAQKGKYAIGAFNTCTIAVTRAIIGAAEKMKAPVIVQTSEGEAKFGQIKPLLAMLRQFAEQASVPVVVQQDHCRDYEMAKTCIQSGYQALLFDASTLPYEKGVAITRRVTDMAHKHGVFMEGELGGFGRGSTLHKGPIPKTPLTDPDQALDFVKRTKVDSLGVSIGNVHGVYEGAIEKLDFERLTAIRKKINIPLVLHGSSGIKFEYIKKAIALGISKINVNTDLRIAFTKALRKALTNQDEFVPYEYMTKASKVVQKLLEERIKLFGSAGKA